MASSPKILGILGGGQLGRMSALAAAELGIKTVIYCPESDAPASQIAAMTINAAYDDKTALENFANEVDVITYEFENVPCETVRYLRKFKPVYPDDRLLEVSQDRVREKSFLNSINIPTARWIAVESVAQVENTLKDWGATEAIFKTTRFGYDGKGQTRFAANANIEESIRSFKNQPLIMEEIVPFACEISVIIARDLKKQVALYGPVINEHKNHILHKTTVPAPIRQSLAQEAQDLTQRLADAVDLTGVLALEMFVTRDDRILANEIAPRTHNSGHWTIDACAVSQFANHVRTVCGLDVGEPNRHADAVMLNLIGNDVKNLGQYENAPDTFLHLYGKAEARPGRKMGHVTFLNPLSQQKNRA
jgi:5-(carboxyamino)imidazole ribonucleotide synthase